MSYQNATVQRRRRHSAPVIQWTKLSCRTIDKKIRLIRGKNLVLVTGAGNGLGRALAGLAFQDQGIFPIALSGSKVILVDHNEEDLKETSGKKMRQFLKHRKIDVELLTIDLSNLQELKSMMNNIDENEKDYEHVILLNNASTIGDVSKQLSDFDDPATIQSFLDLNITSRMFLTTQFCRIFYQSKRTVVHTFRYDATRSASYFGMCHTAQNAIDAFGETFANENPDVKVLHYTPNRLDSRKTTKILETCGNNDVREEVSSLYELDKLQSPLETAKRMSKALEELQHKKDREILRITETDENNNEGA